MTTKLKPVKRKSKATTRPHTPPQPPPLPLPRLASYFGSGRVAKHQAHARKMWKKHFDSSRQRRKAIRLTLQQSPEGIPPKVIEKCIKAHPSVFMWVDETLAKMVCRDDIGDMWWVTIRLSQLSQ